MPEIALPGVDPGELYSFAQAAKLIPSSRGKRLSVKTMHRWRAEGRITAVRRCLPGAKNAQWFVYGRDLLRLFQVTPGATEDAPASQAELRARADKAFRDIERKHGIKVARQPQEAS